MHSSRMRTARFLTDEGFFMAPQLHGTPFTAPPFTGPLHGTPFPGTPTKDGTPEGWHPPKDGTTCQGWHPPKYGTPAKDGTPC